MGIISQLDSGHTSMQHRSTTSPPEQGSSASSSLPPRRPESGRFPPVVITSAQLDQFHDAAHAVLSQTIHEFTRLDGHTVDAARWRCLRSKGTLSVYTDRRPSAHLSSLLVAGTLRAHLTDVMEGLSMDNSYETRRTLSHLHARFLDAEVLGAIEQRSADHPFAFTGFKWALLRATSSGLISNRDICFFEKRGLIEVGGRQLGYFLMQSVDLPECPPSALRKVVRADVSLCYVFEELRDGVVGVYMKGSMESHGPKILWKMARSNFADIAVSIGNAVELAFANRYTRLVYAKRVRGRSSPRARSLTCDVCDTVPSVFDHHYECAGCNKMSVCRKCRGRRDMFERDLTSERLVAAVFCVECIDNVRALAKATWAASKREVNTRDYVPVVEATECDTDHGDPTADDDHVRFADVKFESDVHSDVHSFYTETEDESSDEQAVDSQRSLRQFSLKLAQQLENAGYNDSDSALRLSDLESLGMGDLRRYLADNEANSAPEAVANTRELCPMSASVASSTFSVDDEEEIDLDDNEDEREVYEEEILSIRPARRSTQPPEMLERQVLDRDGSVRSRPHARSCQETGRAHTRPDQRFFARLVEASIAAERTLRLTNEQSRRANRLFTVGQGRSAAAGRS